MKTTLIRSFLYIFTLLLYFDRHPVQVGRPVPIWTPLLYAAVDRRKLKRKALLESESHGQFVGIVTKVNISTKTMLTGYDWISIYQWDSVKVGTPHSYLDCLK